jgi:hypothetical protein
VQRHGSGQLEPQPAAEPLAVQLLGQLLLCLQHSVLRSVAIVTGCERAAAGAAAVHTMAIAVPFSRQVMGGSAGLPAVDNGAGVCARLVC